MDDKNIKIAELEAEKFQRLIIGIFILAAYLINFFPIMYFLTAIIAISVLLGSKYTPFFQIYLKILNKKFNLPQLKDIECIINEKKSRFACLLALSFMVTGILFFHLVMVSIAWIFVLIVSALSIMAGTTGFCLAAAIYAVLFKSKVKQ